MVDLDQTLKASQHLFIRRGGEPDIVSRPGIGFHHLSNLMQKVPWREDQYLYFLLLQGDVYLKRIDLGLEMPSTESIADAEGNPLFIPNQTYLVLGGWRDVEKTRRLLEGANVADWEELYYDWDWLKEDWYSNARVMLEKTTGACFAAYRELVDHVGRQIQE